VPALELEIVFLVRHDQRMSEDKNFNVFIETSWRKSGVPGPSAGETVVVINIEPVQFRLNHYL
jgi:hypothetical protein